MPQPSAKDKRLLQTCHSDIRLVSLVVLGKVPATIASAYRGEEEQNRLYREGKSKLQYPESKHNNTNENGNPNSLAVDMYPVVDEVPWGNKKVFYHFAGYVRATADQLSIPIRSGADWDGDYDLDDQMFNDLGHFELLEV